MKKVIISLVLGGVLLQTGCASFVADHTDGAVGTDLGTRTLGQRITDKSIERTAKINMYKLDQRFKQSRVNIESFQGRVLLTGQVPDAHLKRLAEDNLKAMSDVYVVHNFITVGDQVSYATIMQDLAVTANTKGLIMRAPVLKSNKLLLHTEDGVLYVMGRLNNAEIMDLDEVLTGVGNVTKIVKLIDNIETEQATTAQTSNAVDGENQYPVGLGGAVTTPLADDATVVDAP